MSYTCDNVNCRWYNRRVEILLISAAPGPEDPDSPESGLVEAQQRLRRMVLDTVASPNSRRNYGKALDDLFALAAGRPLTPALFMEYRASMEALSPSTTNVRLSAVRKLVAEARRNGVIGVEDAARLVIALAVQCGPIGNGQQLLGLLAGEPVPQPSFPSAGCSGPRRDPGPLGRLRPSPAGAGLARCRDDSVARGPLGARRSRREGKAGSHGSRFPSGSSRESTRG